MLIAIPNKPKYSNLSEGDLITLTKNDRFIGYATLYARLKDSIILNIDNRAVKTFNELIYEDIPFDFDIEY